MKPVFKSFVDKEEITTPKSGWTPIQQQTTIEDFNKDKKYSFKTLKEVLVESGLVEEKKEPVVEEKLEPILELIKEAVEEKINLPSIVEEKIEEPIVVEKKVEIVNEKSLIDKASEYIKKRVKIEEGDSFQQPLAPNIPNNITDINKRVRYLEQWLAKVSMAGPGGGDANPHDHIEFLERGVRFTPTPRMMYWNNTEDVLNITQADGSTLQVGLENYIRVYNNTANTFANGTHIEFIGVDAEGDAPTFRAFVNNANAQPLYSVGVLTTDVLSNTHGRATVLGLVRDIDTTGNAVGEVWTAGDILWANPAYPGNFTKNKPTAPNVAMAIASVTNSGVTDGSILVRPTIFPRLFYGSFVSTQPQTAANTTSAFAVTLNKTEFSSGFVIENNTRIKALNSGLYNIQFSIQFSSTNAASKDIYIFPKKNGVNIPDSSSVFTLVGNGTHLVTYLNYIVSLNANEYVEIFFGVSDISAQIASPAVPVYSPNIPPVILTVTEVAL